MALFSQKPLSPGVESEEHEEGEISDDDPDWKEENITQESEELSDLNRSSTDPLPLHRISDSRLGDSYPQPPDSRKSERQKRGIWGRQDDSVISRDRIRWGENNSWRRGSPFSAPDRSYYSRAWAQAVQGRSDFLDESLEKDEIQDRAGESLGHSCKDGGSEALMDRRACPPPRPRSLKERLSFRSSDIDECSGTTGFRSASGLSKSASWSERSLLEDSKTNLRRKRGSRDELGESSEQGPENKYARQKSESNDAHLGRTESRELPEKHMALKSRVQRVYLEGTESQGEEGCVRSAFKGASETSDDAGSAMRSEEQETSLLNLNDSCTKEPEVKRSDGREGGELEEGEIESVSKPRLVQSNQTRHIFNYRGSGKPGEKFAACHVIKRNLRSSTRSNSRSKGKHGQGRDFEIKDQQDVKREHEVASSINEAKELVQSVSVKHAQRSFLAACERLIKAIEILENLCSNDPHDGLGESESAQVISRLARQAFDGIRAVYAVRNTATGREQERDKNVFPRLLELSTGCAHKLFTVKQARELEAMMLGISPQTNLAKPSTSAMSVDAVNEPPSMLDRTNEKQSKVSSASENTLGQVKCKMQKVFDTESPGGTFLESEMTFPEDQASDAAGLAATAVALNRSAASTTHLKGMNQTALETDSDGNTALRNFHTSSCGGALTDMVSMTKSEENRQAVGSWGHVGIGFSEAENTVSKPSYKPWTEANLWQSEQALEPLPTIDKGGMMRQSGFEDPELHFEVQNPFVWASTSVSMMHVGRPLEPSNSTKSTDISSTANLSISQGSSALHSNSRGLWSSSMGLDPVLTYKINAANSALLIDRLPSPTPSEEDLEARLTKTASSASLDPAHVGIAENSDSKGASKSLLHLNLPSNMFSAAENHTEEGQWMDASHLVVDLNSDDGGLPGVAPIADGTKSAIEKKQSDLSLISQGVNLKSRDPRRHFTTISAQGIMFKDLQNPCKMSEANMPSVNQSMETSSKKHGAVCAKIEPEIRMSSRAEASEEAKEREANNKALTSSKELSDSNKQSNAQLAQQINDFLLSSKRTHPAEGTPGKENATKKRLGINLDIKDEPKQVLKSTIKPEAGTNLLVDSNKRRMKPRDPRRVLLESSSGRSDVPNPVSTVGGNSLSQASLQPGQDPAASIIGQQTLRYVSDLLASQAFSQGTALPNITPSIMEKLVSLVEVVGSSQGNSISGQLLPMSLPLAGLTQSADKEVGRLVNRTGSSKVDFLQACTSNPLALPPLKLSTEREGSTNAVSTQDKNSVPQASKQSYMDLDHLLKDMPEDERLAIQQERLRRMEEQERMLSARKLCLVLDLDHTLLNSAKFSEIDQEWEQRLRIAEAAERNKDGNNLMRRELFRFPHMSMWTKLRPGIRKFLDTASRFYELHVYTMGNKAYATEMAKLLDPTGTLFAGRVISKGDETDIVDGDEKPPKSKDLDGVLGMESAVVIIDDSARVWPHHRDNLIVVERYMYFPCSRRQFGLPGPSLLEVGHDEREADGMLASTLAVIGAIHQSFFSSQRFREMDVRQILATEQQRVLGGCRIMFSRIFPVGEAQPHLHPLWRTAEQFGATCTTKIDSNVTHVVAISLGTDKVNWALANGKFVVRPAWLEASAVLYRRANERDFPVPP